MWLAGATKPATIEGRNKRVALKRSERRRSIYHFSVRSRAAVNVTREGGAAGLKIRSGASCIRLSDCYSRIQIVSVITQSSAAPVAKPSMKCIASPSLMSALAEIASNRVGELAERSPLGGPAVRMVAIVPAGLPQESRPGGPTGSIKERVVYCCDEKLIRNNVQNNYLKV